MLILQIMSTVTALTLVATALCLIPALGEIKRTTRKVREVSESIEVELKPLIQELQTTITDVKVVATAAAAHADDLNALLEELGRAGHNIHMVNKVLGLASQAVTASSAWMTGGRVAGRYIIDKLIRKNRGGD